MNISTKFDSLIQHESKEKYVTISNKHHIFALITRIGFFKTEMSVKLSSISKLGIMLSSACHILTNAINKNVIIELYIDGNLFIHKACVVSHDIANELYEIRFTQSFEFIDEYLENFNTSPHYGLNASPASNGNMNLKAIT